MLIQLTFRNVNELIHYYEKQGAKWAWKVQLITDWKWSILEFNVKCPKKFLNLEKSIFLKIAISLNYIHDV